MLPQEEVPVALQAPGSVLCVGARSPLDDAAAAMLTEVLTAQGIGARAETAASLSKAAIQELDVTGVKLVCLSALDGSSPAFLRFVLRRLKRRAPEARIVLGTWWRRNGLRETDQEIDAMMKDDKVSTFTDVVQFCMAQKPAAAIPAEPGAPSEAPLLLCRPDPIAWTTPRPTSPSRISR